jgi:hypothetical protein
MRHARIAVSRAGLRHGRGSLEHQQAAQRWAFRQTIVHHLASRCGLRPEDVVMSQVSALCLLEAALTVRLIQLRQHFVHGERLSTTLRPVGRFSGDLNCHHTKINSRSACRPTRSGPEPFKRQRLSMTSGGSW